MYELKVLAVDDEAGMRQGIKRTLDKFHFTVQDVDEEILFSIDTAENGAEAIEKVKNIRPDIILLDYKLPDINGLDILEQIGPYLEDSLAIMVTAYAALETAVSAIKTGAFDFLAKPFTPQELRSIVSKAAQSLILQRHVKKLAEEKRQVRFQFISVLGHELKAPLGAIEGYLYMLQDKTLGNELEKYTESVNRCLVRIDQMRKLILDLLEMTKIESGNRQREMKELDLAEICKSSIETMLPDSQKRGISINLNTSGPVNFTADKTEMEIIFNNMVSNGVKYNRDGGQLNIELSKHGDAVELVFTDTGIGMTKEETEKLFKEFVRIKNSKTKNILGSGLGLSTVKKICQIYRGDCTVDSTPDVGTTFTLKLVRFEEEG